MVTGTAFQPNQCPKNTRFFYFKKWGIGDKLNFQQVSFHPLARVCSAATSAADSCPHKLGSLQLPAQNVDISSLPNPIPAQHLLHYST